VEDVEGSLGRLQRLLLLAGIGGAIIAVALGWLVADRGLVPLRRLATAVNDYAAVSLPAWTPPGSSPCRRVCPSRARSA
jgi:hypothetical protein